MNTEHQTKAMNDFLRTLPFDLSEEDRMQAKVKFRQSLKYQWARLKDAAIDVAVRK